MCGIIGVLNLTNESPISGERLRAGNDALYHRGPDDEGMHVEANVGLAMRRLSIIDVAHGHQPMSNEDGTVHIVYNGEVYNHRALRGELEALGHKFETDADTEAVLHGYEQWGGEGVLERLRGMFAFAIWDRTRNVLFLARDRMGIKPLYFAEHDGRFYFASEIRPLLIHSDMPRKPNFAALEAFMGIGFVASPQTLIAGVEKLPPAHYLKIENGKITRREYWSLTYETTHKGSEKEIIGEFRDRLQDCVDSHLMSDVALGALLSGGVDSTAIVAFMRKTLKEPFKTINLGFEAQGYNESEWAAASARELGTDHYSRTFRNDSLDEFPEAFHFMEEPVAHPVASALYDVFKACKDHGLKVVMTGEGSDELLGGYQWHQAQGADKILAKLPAFVRARIDRSVGVQTFLQGSRNMVRALRGVPIGLHTRYQRTIGLGARGAEQGLLSAEARSALAGSGSQRALDAWSKWLAPVRGRPEFEQLLWIQSRTRMPDYINQNLDRMAMAHSIEARPPFLDHTLWEFCASLPPGIKLRGSTEKYILREAGRNIIPEAARLQKKLALRVPFARWLEKPQLPDWAETALSKQGLDSSGLFDTKTILALRKQVQAGDLVKARLVAGALFAQVWSNIFLESPLVSGSIPTNDSLSTGTRDAHSGH